MAPARSGGGKGGAKGGGAKSGGGAKRGSGRGDRALKVRVKTAKGRKLSSTLWLERQLNDPYVRRAQQDGLRSRAAYKLSEIDADHGLLKPGMRIVDLGAAPGGWSQIAARRIGVGAPGGGELVAVDIQPMDPIPGATMLELDFLEDGADETVKAALGGPADLVLSDMAAPATGHRQTDHLRIMALCEAAAVFAGDVLAPDGAFLCKVLQGGAEAGLLAELKRAFARVRHVKPPASRADSAETYLLAQGFRGAPARENLNA